MENKTFLAVIIAVTTIGVLTGFVLFVDNANLSLESYADTNDEYSSHSFTKTHEYTLIAEDTTIEISPGIRVEAWTYNGTFPGPTLRATEGDRVIVHFVNNGHLPHTVHFHGDHNEINDGVFQEVLPGESYTYDFIAEPAGAMMYHCHIMPVSSHIRNGLYGAFIVDPKEGLEPAREYVIVKGEYDMQDQEAWLTDYVFFNGYADQYWENPLPVKTNELVRIFYVDMGAIPAYGFHIHGTIFDTIISGLWDNEPIKTQTWEVGPGNAAIFEAKWKEPGRYLFHLHGVPEEKGTMGYFDVRDPHEEAVDGIDIAKTKSIYMWEWQDSLTETLQKSDPQGKITTTSGTESKKDQRHSEENTPPKLVETTLCEIEKGSAIKSSNKAFYPEAIKVDVGDTVKWTNKDTTIHTVTADMGTFDSGMMISGDVFEHTFAEQGEFDYTCLLHPWMKGTVVVS